jgi:hypothetical protein
VGDESQNLGSQIGEDSHRQIRGQSVGAGNFFRELSKRPERKRKGERMRFEIEEERKQEMKARQRKEKRRKRTWCRKRCWA